MDKLYIIIFSFILITTIEAQEFTAALIDQSIVANNGLFFDGTKHSDSNPNGNYRFGNRISPHGDCIDVVNGYVFVTWYKGGMNERNLMLSRKKLDDPNANWVTIEFPHRHIGWQGNPNIGDSHNTAAIGVSTIDGTIHLLYDMHAYSSTSYPDNFFNYSVSVKDAAFKPDAEFNLSLFHPKRNYLKQGGNYERITYPTIHSAPDGSLVVRYRIGGAGNGDIFMASYDGNSWSNSWRYSDGTIPLPNRYSLYGKERFIRDTFYSCFSIRYAQNPNYVYNNGFYFAYTDAVRLSPSSQWFDIKGNTISIPIQNPNVVKVAEPTDDYGTATPSRMSSDLDFTVTERGAIHMVTRVDNRNVHYYKLAEDADFSSDVDGVIPHPNGDLYSFNDYVFMVELISGKPVIKATPEGQNNWEIIYSADTIPTTFRHFNALVNEDKLYLYLMQNVGTDARPLHLQVFSLSGGTPLEPIEPPVVEPEKPFDETIVYPNPSRGVFNIDSKIGGINYVVISTLGRVLKGGVVENQQIDLSDYPTGVYFLELFVNGERLVKKIIVH